MNILIAETDAQLKEVERLADIVWREHYSKIISMEQIDYMLKSFQSFNAIKAQLSDGYIYCILEDNEVNVGYISYKIEENAVFLSKIYVLDGFRGKGYAKKAVNYLKNISGNGNKIWLTVNKNNTDSINAYEKMGFCKERSQISDIGSGFVMDDFVMELDSVDMR